MALITCPDCNKEISDKAPTCPNCGCPMTDREPHSVRDKNAEGLMGKPGTFAHTANVGCATLLIGLLIVWFILSLT